jgi:hypothetical protein
MPKYVFCGGDVHTSNGQSIVYGDGSLTKSQLRIHLVSLIHGLRWSGSDKSKEKAVLVSGSLSSVRSSKSSGSIVRETEYVVC